MSEHTYFVEKHFVQKIAVYTFGYRLMNAPCVRDYTANFGLKIGEWTVCKRLQCTPSVKDRGEKLCLRGLGVTYV